MNNAAIYTTIDGLFENYTADTFAAKCHNYVKNDCDLDVGEANDLSWKDCYNFLARNLNVHVFGKYPILFEFMMPESKKRADVVILSQKKVIVLEFKRKNEIFADDISQAAGYGNSIRFYHYETAERKMNVSASLVYTVGEPSGNKDLINILWDQNFKQYIGNELFGEQPMGAIDLEKWVNSPFHVLKNMIDTSYQLFTTGELPNIKSIKEGDIKENLDVLHHIIDTNLGKKIVFVTGVPGAGKTLVGLKILYDYLKAPYQHPIFVSGNDPLVNILQNMLDADFILRIADYKKNAYNTTDPLNRIIIFDEAQRAWNYGGRNHPGENEARELLTIGDKIKEARGPVTIICLIGEGQAIHVHEESGMQLWHDALMGRDDWDVFIPLNSAEDFQNLRVNCIDALFLDTSIRNDFINISPWVEAVLSADLDKAKKHYKEILQQGFNLKLIWRPDHIKRAVEYIKTMNPLAHTGLVVSSHMDKRLEQPLMGKEYRGSTVGAKNAYKWFTEDSEQLRKGASEFLIQGIELDWPIVVFGEDYYLKDGQWTIDENADFDPRIVNRELIMKDAYRVLLTRSRKGMVLYIPAHGKMMETLQWFRKMKSIE